jgi:hypothetical protein
MPTSQGGGKEIMPTYKCKNPTTNEEYCLEFYEPCKN